MRRTNEMSNKHTLAAVYHLLNTLSKDEIHQVYEKLYDVVVGYKIKRIRNQMKEIKKRQNKRKIENEIKNKKQFVNSPIETETYCITPKLKYKKENKIYDKEFNGEEFNEYGSNIELLQSEDDIIEKFDDFIMDSMMKNIDKFYKTNHRLPNFNKNNNMEDDFAYYLEKFNQKYNELIFSKLENIDYDKNMYKKLKQFFNKYDNQTLSKGLTLEDLNFQLDVLHKKYELEDIQEEYKKELEYIENLSNDLDKPLDEYIKKNNIIVKEEIDDNGDSQHDPLVTKKTLDNELNKMRKKRTKYMKKRQKEEQRLFLEKQKKLKENIKRENEKLDRMREKKNKTFSYYNFVN